MASITVAQFATELTGIDDERAKTLIMAARAHWFESAEQSSTAA